MSNSEIVIIDYHMGNLRSVQKAVEKLGAKVVISNEHDVIMNASKIILPGVGSFNDGMKNLKILGLIDVLKVAVLQNKAPFLGICLGMQLIFGKSYEHGDTKGLSWIEGEVVRFNFKSQDKKLKVPHVGWNNVLCKNINPLFECIPDSSDFYFVHSYHVKTKEDVVSSVTDYGLEFVSSINKNNVYGVQFHPEKSQGVGLMLLKNFINLEADSSDA